MAALDPKLIDSETFQQILDMDDDEAMEFSRTIVEEFFSQASITLNELANSIKIGDLPQVTSKGHFLKGSSATLGFVKVRDSCEKIQHLGNELDEAGLKHIKDKAESIKRITNALRDLSIDIGEVKDIMKAKYPDAVLN